MLNSSKHFSPHDKINDLNSGGDDWLPTDRELFARTKTWANFFSKYSVEEDDRIALDLNDNCIDKLLDSDEESKESVDSADFVDSDEKEDPNFDVEKVLNQTLKVIEKRKKNWDRSGFDKIMESSFRMDEYSKKVDSWLDGNSRYLADCKFHRNGGLPRVDEIQVRDRRVYVERSSSPDSGASVDTVKYILSNKKKQKTRYRTTTIKEYRFSRRRLEEQDQCCRKIVSKTYDERCSDFGRRKPTSPRSKYSDLTPNLRPHYNSEPFRQKLRKRHRSKSLRMVESSDSSSSSDCKSEEAGRFRRIRQPKRICYKKSSALRETSPSDDHSETQNSEISFVPENVVNSTEISNKLTFGAPRSDLQSIPEDNETTTVCSNNEVNDKSKTPSSNQPKKKRSTLSPIVIYTPEDTSKNRESSITNGKILLTRKMLEDSIGPELAKIYLNLNKDFSHEFDHDSKILFYPPEEVVVTSDSEADILEHMSWNTVGRIVEILNSK